MNYKIRTETWRDYIQHPAPLMFIPPLVFALSQGNIYTYRMAQYAWIASIIILVFANNSVKTKRPSLEAVYFIIFLWIPFIVTGIRNEIYGIYDIKVDTFLKISAFTAAILSIDQYRNESFMGFMSRGFYIALSICIVTLLAFLFHPVVVWGRHTFFGEQPNWGGEILFVCAIAALSNSSAYKRIALVLIIIALLYFLQSRAALLGVLIMWSMVEVFVHGLKFNFAKYVFSLVLLSLFSLLVVYYANPEISQSLIAFVGEDVLRLNDPYRGLGTGLVGRAESYANTQMFLEQFPLWGAGLDNAIWGAGRESIHNGVLALTAEYGIFSAFIWMAFLVRFAYAVKFDRFVAIVMIASFFVFFFSARTINLNIFPLVMWLMILPWSHQLVCRNDAS